MNTSDIAALKNNHCETVRSLMSDGIPRDRNSVSVETHLEKDAVSKTLHTLEATGYLRVYGDIARVPRKYIATEKLIKSREEEPPARVADIQVCEEQAEEIEITGLAEAAIAAADSWAPPARMIIHASDAPALRKIAKLLAKLPGSDPLTRYLEDVAERMERAA